MIKIAKSSAAAVVAVLLSSPVWAASTITRTSSFAYDGSGLLNQEVVEPDTPTLRLQTDYAYDAFGNKISATVSGNGVTSRTSQTGYVTNGQFPASATNALGQSESYQFDARFGQPIRNTGPNGLTTTWSYDSFGRKIQEIRADGTQTKWTYSFCSGINGGTANCPTGASYLTAQTPYAANGTTVNGPVLTVYFDQLDREVARDTQGFDGSTLRAAKQYDALGRVSKTSRPYVLASGTPQWTSYAYDTLGRVVREARPDGSVTQMAYHGLSVTETNAKSQTRTVVKNSQGKLVSVTDPLGSTMTYAYDAVGNTVRTTDAVGNIVSATYDQRGRRVASSDPDLGSWTYAYNVFGELTSQTDAKGQTTTIAYDKLGRMVQRVEADVTSIWSYDTAARGIGKLASSSITAGRGAGFVRSLSYDTLGRPSQIATTVDGTTYTMGAVYDANSRLSKVSYPSGFTARYGYNSLKIKIYTPADFEKAFDALYVVHGTDQAADGLATGEDVEFDVQRLRDIASEAPIIRLVNQIITGAVESRASDIHIEPNVDHVAVRYRVDGVLRNAQILALALRSGITSRLKIMAKLDIAERRLPQDGRIKIAIRGIDIDFRVSTLPTIFGESVVLRVLDRGSITLDFAELGFFDDHIAAFKKLLDEPNGVILVTGPTGSGKTTTLYTALKSLNSGERKIFSVEDPVEYQILGINQVQVQAEIGFDFPDALRSILRQDPDIIMIGEIRDLQTARIAIQSSLTGHLVLSTLHTNSAASAITRMLDIGVENYLLASTVKGVIAQRLVRRLCRYCACEHRQAAHWIGVLQRTVPLIERFGEPKIREAVGCQECGGTGHMGRCTIAEVLLIDSEVQRLILAKAADDELERTARGQGMRSMYEMGAAKIWQGETTMEEVLRATRMG